MGAAAAQVRAAQVGPAAQVLAARVAALEAEAATSQISDAIASRGRHNHRNRLALRELLRG